MTVIFLCVMKICESNHRILDRISVFFCDILVFLKFLLVLLVFCTSSNTLSNLLVSNMF